MKSILKLFCLFFITMNFASCDILNTLIATPTPLSNEEVIKGLKSALHVGIDTSVAILSKSDGYFKDAAVKILLPDEARPIYKVINKIPGGNILLDKAVLAVNRSAEDAAPEAKVIFVNAITQMTIADGFQILNGGETAATTYLKEKTYAPLTGVFKPRINTSLSKPLVFNVSASKAYSDLIDAYNKASLGGVLWSKIQSNTLSDYVTAKALDGLFLKVAAEEKQIRLDPMHQVNEILKRVFSK